MSIVIVSMTETVVSVVADSRMTTKTGSNESAQKIYMYSPTMVMYGVGTAGVVFDFFNALNRIKEDINGKFRYKDAITFINEWKNYAETSEPYLGRFCAIGVCGIDRGMPEATTIAINAGLDVTYQNITRPNSGITFYILPPADLTNDVCNDAFISNSQGISRPVSLEGLILCSTNTVADLCHRSVGINSNCQYWGYDLRNGRQKEKLIDFSR